MHIYSTVSISRSSLLQQRKWTTIYVTVLHKLQKKKIIEHICSPYFLREGVAQLLLQNGASYVLPTAITFIVHALF